jgi:type IV pilus assembly protein PilY1
VGSNDGQLHVFDAGIFAGDDCRLPNLDDRDGDGQPDGDGDPIEGAFDNGTGKELFSFVPRMMLPHLRDLVRDDRQDWGLDNTPRIADVFIDPNATTAGSVACLDREWRTVLIGGYREGGSGYFALDITQPDELDSANVPQPINGYVPSCLDGSANCGNRPFPYTLWEFYDAVPGDSAARMDEDLNNLPDLAETWGVPAVTRIRTCDDVCANASIEDRFVAIFGGGLGESGATEPTGNFVYMVDIETGSVLWKEPVAGAVPGDVVPVSGGDGYLKYLYFGTTDGFVYKSIFDSAPMRIADVTVTTRIAGVNTDVTTKRLVGPIGDTDRYDPFQVFTTNGKPIYHELAVIFVQQRNAYALGFGTGNRWNLWDFTGNIEGRFYMLLDTGFVDANRDGVLDAVCVGVGCTQPLTETAYEELIPDTNPGDLTNFLLDAADLTPGWWLRLGANERVINEPFALSGITIFTSFLPDEIENPDGTCSRTGQSHIFIVGTLSGGGYWFPDPDDPSERARYFVSEYFHSASFVERGATGNLTPQSGGTNADQLTDSLELVREELKRLFPANCRFGNFTQNVKTLRQDTNIVFIAPVPICIEPTNFREF